jgi:hypothetical protein
MKKIIIVICIALTLAGCGKVNVSTIDGKWECLSNTGGKSTKQFFSDSGYIGNEIVSGNDMPRLGNYRIEGDVIRIHITNLPGMKYFGQSPIVSQDEDIKVVKYENTKFTAIGEPSGGNGWKVECNRIKTASVAEAVSSQEKQTIPVSTSDYKVTTLTTILSDINDLAPGVVDIGVSDKNYDKNCTIHLTVTSPVGDKYSRDIKANNCNEWTISKYPIDFNAPSTSGMHKLSIRVVDSTSESLTIDGSFVLK